MSEDEDAADRPTMGSIPDLSAYAELVAVTLLPDPAGVVQVRRSCRAVLAGSCDEAVIDDVVLVVSELVTNALIHSGRTIQFSLGVTASEVLVRVSDESPHEPRPRAYGGEARTGRGLSLVEALTTSWGYAPTGVGKVVWGLVSTTPSAEVVLPPSTIPRAFPAPSAARTTNGEVDVELREVPQLLHAAWRQHAQALLRDLLLSSWNDDDALTAVDDLIQIHAQSTDAIALLDERIPRMGIIVDIDHDFLSLAEPAISLASVVIPVPRSSLEHFAVLDRMTGVATRLAEEGRLLTPPPSPEIAAFQGWVCRQVLSQARDLPPEPWQLPLGDAHAGPDGVRRLVPHDGEPARPSLAIDRSGRITVANQAVESLLGYATGGLDGLPVVRIVPPRHRQAHVAGLTMFNLTDRRNLFDHAVRVAVLRQDGTELDVQLILTRADATSGESVAVAELRPSPDPISSPAG